MFDMFLGWWLSFMTVFYVFCFSSIVDSMPAVHYEYPNGYNQDFGSERFKVCEGLFDPSVIKVMQLHVCVGVTDACGTFVCCFIHLCVCTCVYVYKLWSAFWKLTNCLFVIAFKSFCIQFFASAMKDLRLVLICLLYNSFYSVVEYVVKSLSETYSMPGCGVFFSNLCLQFKGALSSLCREILLGSILHEHNGRTFWSLFIFYVCCMFDFFFLML